MLSMLLAKFKTNIFVTAFQEVEDNSGLLNQARSDIQECTADYLELGLLEDV